MLHYFKFHQDLLAPQPAKESYVKRRPGKGWPEECPPLRAGNSFGFDLPANFDITFIRKRDGGWKVDPDIVIESDFEYAANEEGEGVPLKQQYAWFWQKGQKLPHVISDNVYMELRNQVKVSSFLFLKTDPNEVLLMTDVPIPGKRWRHMTALIETDWYAASYPWHCVLELDSAQKRIEIKKGEPLARIIPVRRDTYFAKQMAPADFDAFFDRGQNWLSTHGKIHEEGTVDIRHTYVRQQAKSRFIVME